MAPPSAKIKVAVPDGASGLLEGDGEKVENRILVGLVDAADAHARDALEMQAGQPALGRCRRLPVEAAGREGEAPLLGQIGDIADPQRAHPADERR